MKSNVCEEKARVSGHDRDEVKSEKPSDLSVRLGQPSSGGRRMHTDGLGRLGVPAGDEMVQCVWCQSSSGQ
jgi:hypothetical protein